MPNDKKILLEKKAIIALGGPLRLPEDFQIPFRISRSTAGPGAGFPSIAISFNGLRVKKSITTAPSEFELVQNADGSLSILRNGDSFLDNVELQPVIRHCPGQAFFNLDQRCENRCAFCSSPRLDPNDVKDMNADRILELIDESRSLYPFTSIALTSGVIGSVSETVERLARAVSSIRARYPDFVIGVEPYIDDVRQLKILKDAGTDEIKLNLQCANEKIFSRVCPDLDRDTIWRMLESAVAIFGKGSVTSNVIYGMGESDGDLTAIMEKLCSIGVIPGMRALRVNKYNRESLTEAIGVPVPVDPGYMVEIARRQRETMARYGLDTNTCHTMCLECGCCDIVPFRDL